MVRLIRRRHEPLVITTTHHRSLVVWAHATEWIVPPKQRCVTKPFLIVPALLTRSALPIRLPAARRAWTCDERLTSRALAE